MKIRKFLSIIILLLCSLFFVSCNTINSTNITSSKNMTVHYIDVGQGDSILIQVNNKNMLIDAGTPECRDDLTEYLDNLNIKKLDYVIATHPHADHIGSMATIIKKYDIGAFYAPKKEHTTKTYEKMIDALVSKNLKINPIKADIDSINLGENTSVEVFSPNKSDYGSELNLYSPIIKVTYGKNSFLFTGDAEKENEKEVLSKKYDLSADVLKLGHHGSSSSTTKEFYKAVNPSIVVISLSTPNNYGHPHKETLELLKKENPIIYRTDKDGTIVLTSDGESIKH